MLGFIIVYCNNNKKQLKGKICFPRHGQYQYNVCNSINVLDNVAYNLSAKRIFISVTKIILITVLTINQLHKENRRYYDY